MAISFTLNDLQVAGLSSAGDSTTNTTLMPEQVAAVDATSDQPLIPEDSSASGVGAPAPTSPTLEETSSLTDRAAAAAELFAESSSKPKRRTTKLALPTAKTMARSPSKERPAGNSLHKVPSNGSLLDGCIAELPTHVATEAMVHTFRKEFTPEIQHLQGVVEETNQNNNELRKTVDEAKEVISELRLEIRQQAIREREANRIAQEQNNIAKGVAFSVKFRNYGMFALAVIGIGLSAYNSYLLQSLQGRVHSLN